MLTRSAGSIQRARRRTSAFAGAGWCAVRARGRRDRWKTWSATDRGAVVRAQVREQRRLERRRVSLRVRLRDQSLREQVRLHERRRAAAPVDRIGEAASPVKNSPRTRGRLAIRVQRLTILAAPNTFDTGSARLTQRARPGICRHRLSKVSARRTTSTTLRSCSAQPKATAASALCEEDCGTRRSSCCRRPRCAVVRPRRRASGSAGRSTRSPSAARGFRAARPAPRASLARVSCGRRVDDHVAAQRLARCSALDLDADYSQPVRRLLGHQVLRDRARKRAHVRGPRQRRTMTEGRARCTTKMSSFVTGLGTTVAQAPCILAAHPADAACGPGGPGKLRATDSERTQEHVHANT